MNLDFLTPVEDVLIAHNALLAPNALGNSIAIHADKSGMPDLEGVSLAIIGVSENRNSHISSVKKADLTKIRQELYKLYAGNWSKKIADLGDVPSGAQVSDTYYVLAEVVADLVKNQIIPIIIGGSQDLTYAAYRAFDKLEQMVNLTTVDASFDIGALDQDISSKNFLSKIIVDAPTNLFNFSNLGYQSYYVSQEELDLVDKMHFEAYRLGQTINDIKIVEPVMRDADLVSIDMTSVQASDVAGIQDAIPNGFSNREICAIARYAGISDKVSVFGVFECQDHSIQNQLTAQLLWYFIEGCNYRVNEYPFTSKEQYTKYIVPNEEEEALEFYKSNVTERWWIKVPFFESLNTKVERHALLPCTEQDYLDATSQIIPERWWKAYRRNIN